MDDARALGRRPLLAVLAALVVAAALSLLAANAFGAGGSGDRPATSPYVAQTQIGGGDFVPTSAGGGFAHQGDDDCPFKDGDAITDAADV